jgi:hypothetical protein
MDVKSQSLAYVYSRENSSDAHMAKALTEDGARRIATNIAKLPTLAYKAWVSRCSARCISSVMNHTLNVATASQSSVSRSKMNQSSAYKTKTPKALGAQPFHPAV